VGSDVAIEEVDMEALQPELLAGIGTTQNLNSTQI
jgi:hypothetical protein